MHQPCLFIGGGDDALTMEPKPFRARLEKFLQQNEFEI
jgi:hypothetical protein